MYKNGRLLTITNYVLALHLVGRNEEAYALAASEPARALPSQRAWMWIVGADDQLTLSSEEVDVRSYLADLANHLDTCCSVRPDGRER